MKGGLSVPGSRYTCGDCGQSFIRGAWTWAPVSTLDEIRELQAIEAARRAREGS